MIAMRRLIQEQVYLFHRRRYKARWHRRISWLDYDLKRWGILGVLIVILVVCAQSTKAKEIMPISYKQGLIVTHNGLCYNETVKEREDEVICNR